MESSLYSKKRLQNWCTIFRKYASHIASAPMRLDYLDGKVYEGLPAEWRWAYLNEVAGGLKKVRGGGW